MLKYVKNVILGKMTFFTSWGEVKSMNSEYREKSILSAAVRSYSYYVIWRCFASLTHTLKNKT